MQYLYNDGELYYFMDQETYDQIPLTFDQVEDAMKYLRENDEATIKSTKEMHSLWKLLISSISRSSRRSRE